MATVTGMTAAAMQAIRDGTVVSATFDAANHLILTKYDGTQVDGGTIHAATTALAGPVALATNAETQSGSSTTKAVTPAGLASLPGYRIQIVSGIAESATPASWPYGVSLQSVNSTDAWSIGSSSGTIVTNSVFTDRTFQTFYASTGGTNPIRAWTRVYHSTTGGGGWTAWQPIQIMNNLSATSFTQLTAASSYPDSWSRLFYTTSNSTSWDFSGLTGEVATYRDAANNFTRQTFTQFVSGSQNTPQVWYRTSDNTIGWSNWHKSPADLGWLYYTPTWTTTSGLHLPSLGNATVNWKAFKSGRKVDVQFDVTFGSTTNFGSGATTTDNWTFSLPPAWPAVTTAGTFLGIGDMYHDKTNLGFTRIKLTGSSSVSFGILATWSGTSSLLDGDIGGDVDSVSPWVWASGDALRGTFSYETAA